MTLGEKIHGEKPQIAPFIPTDPMEMLQLLLSGEISSWPQIEQLSNLYQTYMMQAYEQAIPGFADILKQGQVDTSAILKQAEPLIHGEIPEDVKGQVMRSGAFQNLLSGGGPNFLHSLQARDLGLTSLNLINQGAQLADIGGNAEQRWQGIASQTILPPTASMYTPEQFYRMKAEQNMLRMQHKQMAYNMRAAPDPAWKDRAELLAQYGGMALGGGMGGGGGQSGYSMGQTAGQNYGFGGNYQFGMYGGQASGAGGAAGMAMSPWKAGSTDMYFPTQQSWNNYQGYGGSPWSQQGGY